MPLNKKIYSISFAALSTSISGITIMIFYYLLDVYGKGNEQFSKIVNLISSPLFWLGRNPLFVFVGMDALTIILIKYITIDGKSAYHQFYHYCFKSWISNAHLCSTVFALFFVILWTVLAGLLHWRRIFIKL